MKRSLNWTKGGIILQHACVPLVAQLCSGILLAQPSVPAVKPGSAFQECVTECPVMIVVPAGKFMMGSPEKERDWEATGRPQHEVMIAKPFAVSKFEVTYAEWDVLRRRRRMPARRR